MAFERRLDAERMVIALNPGTDVAVLDASLDGVAYGRLEPVGLDGDRAASAAEPTTGEPTTGPADVASGRGRIARQPRAGRGTVRGRGFTVQAPPVILWR